MASIKRGRDGKWFCRVSYKDEATGKYKTKGRYGIKTKKEAQSIAQGLEEEIENIKRYGHSTAPKDIIFADYFEEWCHTFRMQGVSPHTYQNYLTNIRIVRQYFGGLKLIHLTRKRYQEFINWRGRGRTKNTLTKTHVKIKGCIETAMADGLITRDPTHHVTLNHGKSGAHRLKYFDHLEAETFARRLRRDMPAKPHAVILYIALTTGLRIGEIYGLAWTDITKKQLTVRGGYDYKNYEFTEGKTPSAKRAVAITSDLYSVIKRYQLTAQRRCPNYLFLDGAERPVISNVAVTKYMKAICRTERLPELTPHALRHTHCSLLIAKGLNISYISKRLGHATVAETLKTYTHVIAELEESEDRKALAAMDDFAAK